MKFSFNVFWHLSVAALLLFSCNSPKKQSELTKIPIDQLEKYLSSNIDSALVLLDSCNVESSFYCAYYWGRYYYKNGEYSQADSLFQKVMQQLPLRDTLHQFSQYHLSKIRFYERRLGESEELLTPLLAQTNLPTHLRMKVNIVLSLIATERIDSASAYYFERKALQQALILKDSTNLALLYGNIGINYTNKDNGDSALFYANKALEIYQTKQDSFGITTMLILKSSALRKRGEYRKSEQILINLHEHWPSQADSMDLGWVYINLSELYRLEKRYDQAGKYARKAYSFFSLFDRLAEQRIALHDILLVYFTQRDPSMGQYFDLMLNVLDSIEHRNTGSIQQQSDQKIEAIQARQESELARVRLKIAEQGKKLAQLQLIFVVIISGFTIFILFRLYRKYKSYLSEKEIENSLLQEDLEKVKISEKEALEKLMLLGGGMVENKDIFDHILNELSAAKKTGSINAKDIELSIKNRENKIDDREVFIYYLQKIQEGFMQKLKAKYPKLTETELKLCGLISLNLPSKKIATLLNVEAKSLEIYRYRIRKKIGLSGEDDLVSFFKSFSLSIQ